jgi:hypothetical protein
MTDLILPDDNKDYSSGDSTENKQYQSDRKRFKSDINENNQEISANKFLICSQCQIRLHTRETFLNHYSMHQQGYTFCKRCLQFYKLQIDSNHVLTKSHICEQKKLDESIQISTHTLSLLKDTKFDELHSLEQLIPPDTIEQQDIHTISKEFSE